jgi:hypothetical protein
VVHLRPALVFLNPAVSERLYWPTPLHTKKQDARFAYVAPLYSQAKDMAWKYVKRLTEDVPGVKLFEYELRADFPNGNQERGAIVWCGRLELFTSEGSFQRRTNKIRETGSSQNLPERAR